ncbi:MAG: hypothetical protein J6334_14400 [Kiritimatiellae bacterium]|nr:hypothetical protein [Kiritimatiellia bacterium]
MRNAIMVLVGIGCVWGASAREVVDLNGIWQFRFEENRPLEEVADPAFAATDPITVPCCFDMLPKWDKKRGTGLYRRTFELKTDVRNAFLTVDGMGLRGQFFIDGKAIGLVALPYSRFEVATGPLAAGTHTLAAALDNRFDNDKMRLFLPYYDFYAFGGFYHGVSLILQTAPAEPDTVRVRTRDYTTGTVELEVTFRGDAPTDFDAEIRFDTEAAPRSVAFKQGRATLAVPAFKCWSPESPSLHTVTLGFAGTHIQSRFGIREIKTEGKRLLLNGKPLYLKGANRHESHPTFGAATPESLMVRDIQLLKGLGGNFFRGAHYPQAQRFLELCDEMGVLVWEESLGWGNTAKQMADPEFIRLQIEQTRLMVRNSFNHPSVIIFAFLNEFESQKKEGKALADQLIETIKAEDSGRLVTFACNHNWDDICNEKTDLIAFNTYPGWIGSDAGSPENLRSLVTNAVNTVIRLHLKKYADKPIIVSEMGTCAIYGQHDTAGAQWTEEFQAEYDGDILEAVLATPEIAGLTFWQFADSPSYHRGGATIRTKPFGLNLAGLFDGYRRPKLSAERVRKGFSKDE